MSSSDMVQPARSRADRPSLSEQSAKVVEDVKELGSTAAARAGDALHDARAKGHEAMEAGRAKAHEARDGVEDLVRRYPIRSLLIAAGVGAVFSLVARR